MILFKNLSVGPGMVIYTYNLSYSRDRDQEITILGQPGEKVSKTPSRPMIQAYNISYMGSIRKRITIQGQHWAKNSRPYPKNNESKKDWEHGSSGKHLPHNSKKGPEFKPLYHQKKIYLSAF
jgi:hypothetical protein